MFQFDSTATKLQLNFSQNFIKLCFCFVFILSEFFSFLHSSFISFHFTLFCFFFFFIILSYYGNCCFFLLNFVFCFYYSFIILFFVLFMFLFSLSFFILSEFFFTDLCSSHTFYSLSLIRKFCARSLFCARFSPNKNSTFCLQLCLVKACEKEMSIN